METYQKINTLFKKFTDGPNKGRMIEGAWTTPELEYLAGNPWEFTEKVDGTNIRIGWENCTHPQIRGRSDNASIPTPLADYLWNYFTADLFEDALALDLDNKSIPVILFGEGYGPKIQGGGKYRDDHSFVLFDVLINGFYLSRDDVNDIADKLGIESVPVIGTGTLYDAIDIVKGGLESAWTKVSAYHEPFEAEGIVARPVVPLFDRKGERIITKVKAVDFR